MKCFFSNKVFNRLARGGFLAEKIGTENCIHKTGSSPLFTRVCGVLAKFCKRRFVKNVVWKTMWIKS
jgi:hypothetical protein